MYNTYTVLKEEPVLIDGRKVMAVISKTIIF